MKTKDWLILAGAPLFAWLQYKQAPGINYTLYAAYAAFCMAASHTAALQHKNWWYSLAAVTIAAGSVAFHDTATAFFGTIFSLLLLAAYSTKPQLPAVLNFTQSGINMLIGVPNFFREIHIAGLHKKKNNKETGNGWIYIIVVAVFLVFVSLYSAASGAFNQLLQQINLRFISFGWLLSALLGLFITFGLVKHRRLRGIDTLEEKLGQPLTASLSPDGEKQVRNKQENKAGTLLLALLNLLLLVVNAADAAFLLGNTQGIENYSEMVHQGVNALIASIICAIGIILYFFRGQLNFDVRAKNLYILALLWMLQNLVLIATSGIKNSMYINHVDGLTYKRVGVYYYLLLSAIGLIFTAVKIYARKPNWYLVRVNFSAFFIVLIASCPIDWDIVITRFNISQAEAKEKDPDMFYLLSLGNRNLPLLAHWALEHSADTTKLKNYSPYQLTEINTAIYNRSVLFMEKCKQADWQSYSYTRHHNYKTLNAMNIEKLTDYNQQITDELIEAQRMENERLDSMNRVATELIQPENNNK